jgi:hypothetical protein
MRPVGITHVAEVARHQPTSALFEVLAGSKSRRRSQFSKQDLLPRKVRFLLNHAVDNAVLRCRGIINNCASMHIGRSIASASFTQQAKLLAFMRTRRVGQAEGSS